MAKTKVVKKKRPDETMRYTESDVLLYQAGMAFGHDCTVLLRRWIDESNVIQTKVLSVKGIPVE